MAVKPGDPILKHLTAAWYNEVTKSASPQRLTGGGSSIDQFPRLILTVRRDADETTLPKYSPIFLGAPFLNYDKAFDISHEAVVFNKNGISYNPNQWGVLLEPLKGLTNSTAKVLYLGLTWVRIPDADAAGSGTTLVCKNNSAEVKKGHGGKAEILYETSVGGETLFLVLLGTNTPTELFFELSGNMVAIDYPMVSDELPNTRLTAKAPANFYNFNGDLQFSDDLYSWDGIVDDKGTGFKGTAVLMNGNWLFDQGNCNQADMIISS